MFLSFACQEAKQFATQAKADLHSRSLFVQTSDVAEKETDRYYAWRDPLFYRKKEGFVLFKNENLNILYTS
ncbi:hypothetical protein BAMA111019_09790 [Bacillus manliponensis]